MAPSSFLGHFTAFVTLVRPCPPADKNGAVDFLEFRTALIERLSLPLSSMQLREVWAAIDVDRSGAIDYREFAIALFPEVGRTAAAPCHQLASCWPRGVVSAAKLEMPLPLASLRTAWALVPPFIPRLVRPSVPGRSARHGALAAERGGRYPFAMFKNQLTRPEQEQLTRAALPGQLVIRFHVRGTSVRRKFGAPEQAVDADQVAQRFGLLSLAPAKA